MKTINHSGKTFEEICKMEVIGCCLNKWRERLVYVYADPENPDWVYSIGTRFDDTERIVCHEQKSGFKETIAKWPQTYTYN